MRPRDPHWWRQRTMKFCIRPIHQFLMRFENPTFISELDWDVLIVYDACRYDLFEEVIDTSEFEEYTHILSPASRTPEWVQRNWQNRDFGDTVYVSSISWVERYALGSFHDVVSVWEDDGAYIPTPEETTEAALQVREQYPNKRLVVHYGQPHVPFFTEDGRVNPWDDIRRGQFPTDELWDLYRENLKYVWDESEPIRGFDGRVIVTSDHGNLVGERLPMVPIRMFEHPKDIIHEMLRKVPLGVYQNGRRREIITEETTDGVVEESQVRKNLKELGYLQ